MRFAGLILAALAGAGAAQLIQEPKVVRGTKFELVDDAGRTRAVLGMSKSGSPEFDLRDADGRPRALLLLDRDNLPVFFFKDAEVVTRAKWELDAKGSAKLTFCDADLTPRVEIDGSAPSLQLNDPKGKATWKSP